VTIGQTVVPADSRSGVLLWGRGWEVDPVRAGLFEVGLFHTKLVRCLKIELQRQPGVDHPFSLFNRRGRAPNGRVETFSCLFPNRLQGCNSVDARLLRGRLGSQSIGLVGTFLDCCSQLLELCCHWANRCLSLRTLLGSRGRQVDLADAVG
jgi:hypothetical protein